LVSAAGIRPFGSATRTANRAANRLVVGDNLAQEHMTPVLRPGRSGSDAERHQIKDRRGISMINVA
jgi:hypothetical protein